jgi:DNA-binding NarL/FixJ family response regulator
MQEADRKIAQLKQAGQGGGSMPVEREHAPDQVPEPADVDPRHAEVYALADQGRTPPEIAQQLGRPHGEVELILALRTR